MRNKSITLILRYSERDKRHENESDIIFLKWEWEWEIWSETRRDWEWWKTRVEQRLWETKECV